MAPASLPPELARLARAHRRRQQHLGQAAAAHTARLWRFLAVPGDWAMVAPRVLAVVRAALIEAARGSQTYVAAAVRAAGGVPDPAGAVIGATLAATASDGRDLATLLAQPAEAARALVAEGMASGPALAAGGRDLDRIVVTQTADAARVSTGVAVVADQAVAGWVRMLTPPSCSRCVILAGRVYRWNQGFERHPRCLPAGVVVSGPASLAATRRWYQGELVIVSTASGQRLPVTGNHPVLTDRGWLPAHLLVEGDHVVRSTRSQGAGSLVVPDEDQMPARIEDVWRSNGMVSLGQMPTTAEDFHGDGGNGEVDVVLADRLLGNGVQAALDQGGSHRQFSGRVDLSALLASLGASDEQIEGLAGTPYGVVGGTGLSLSLAGALAAGAHPASLRHGADGQAGRFEPSPDHVAADPVPVGDAVLALARAVGRGQFVQRKGVFAPRWDAPAGPLTVESRVAYARRGQDLLFRLAGQVELDRVVEVSRIDWSGHVFNLTSAEGWYSANGLMVSNCDCVHIPATEDVLGDGRTDPRRYFEGLSEAQQNKVFTIAGARAIRDGADIGRTVNARRGANGLTPAGGRLTEAEKLAARGGRQRGRLARTTVGGRDVYTTTVRAAGRGGKRVRLMPESLYELAGDDRAEALRLLRVHGYLIGG